MRVDLMWRVPLQSGTDGGDSSGILILIALVLGFLFLLAIGSSSSSRSVVEVSDLERTDYFNERQAKAVHNLIQVIDDVGNFDMHHQSAEGGEIIYFESRETGEEIAKFLIKEIGYDVKFRGADGGFQSLNGKQMESYEDYENQIEDISRCVKGAWVKFGQSSG
jgi:hypothetical protein